MYTSNQMLENKTIYHTEHTRPFIPGRTYVAMITPKKVEVKVLCICNGKDEILVVKKIDAYLLYSTVLFSYLYHDGKLYHLTFSTKITSIDDAFNTPTVLKYKGKEKILKLDPISYDEFKKEINKIIEEVEKLLEQNKK